MKPNALVLQLNVLAGLADADDSDLVAVTHQRAPERLQERSDSTLGPQRIFVREKDDMHRDGVRRQSGAIVLFGRG